MGLFKFLNRSFLVGGIVHEGSERSKPFRHVKFYTTEMGESEYTKRGTKKCRKRKLLPRQRGLNKNKRCPLNKENIW